MEAREVKSLKAPSPIIITPSGITMEVMESQSLKASSPILVTGYITPL